MTIITGTEYKASPSKYNKRAQEGERVLISSRSGYMELKPVAVDDKAVKEHIAAKSFIMVATRARKEQDQKKTMILKTHEDIDRYFDSM